MSTEPEVPPSTAADDFRAHPDVFRHRWPKQLNDFVDVLQAEFGRVVEQERAAELAGVGVLALARYCGGRMFYLPRGQAADQAVRDRRIFSDYDGKRDTVVVFAKRYGLTEQQVYSILERQRKLNRAERGAL